MIQARIRKQYAPGPDSAGFSLDLEFSAAAGVTVLFGSSGSGKTLTLDSIAGFVRPDEGRILLDDQILFDGAAGVHLAAACAPLWIRLPELRAVSAHDAAAKPGVRGGTRAAPGPASQGE